uniref:Cadherin domain-containing protein n=1 Tax=Takifugu rubripes TaxID=31033 RepID=A0A674PMK5_TAKRU
MAPFRFYTAWTEKSKQCTSLPLLLLIQVSQSKLTVFSYNTIVSEDSPAGTVFAMVTASDIDEGVNGELSGNVYTTGVLQWAEDLVLNVHVEDAGETPKSDTSTISIRFQNIAEFPQISVEILNGSIPENVPVGTLVAVVSAASTRAEPVSFYLASGNLDNKFHVDQVSGALTVDNPLDYEDKKGFALLMEARDSASPPFSSFEEIHISISDINDNYPQFTQAEYRCEVFENHPPSWICDVLAVDADFDNMSLVLYNIIDGNVNNYFMLDHENGLLSTTAALDREDISTFNLTIEAAELNNPSHRDRATVIVSVLDRNDNAPRFSQIFSIEVPEDSPVGHSAIQISSSDDDLGTNAVINYFIIDQLSNQHHCDSETGTN